MKKIDVFICSKPLQYLNICNIPTSYSNNKILIICDAFYKAQEFANNIRKNEKQWNKVIFTKGYNWFFHVLRYKVNNLYYGLDSTIIGVLHYIKRFNFYLYEEGAGSYRFLQIQNKYKYLARFLGTGGIMGQSKYLKKIFVYHPNYYVSQIHPSCPVSTFNISYREMIKQNSSNFINLYNFNENEASFLKITNSKILLYITDWEYQTSTIRIMQEQISNYDYLFVKPHPHIKENILSSIEGINIIYTSLVVEVILDVWLKGNNSITVYHQDSTAIIPFGKEIDTINVNINSDLNYRKIIEHLTILSSNECHI